MINIPIIIHNCISLSVVNRNNDNYMVKSLPHSLGISVVLLVVVVVGSVVEGLLV